MKTKIKDASITIPLPGDKERLLQLLKKEAVSKGKITLSSGKVSDFYIDARRVTLSAEGAYLCGKIILGMVKDDVVDCIGGPSLGADPLVGSIGVLSFQGGKPINTFIIRKTPKTHGKQQQIEGPSLKSGHRVVLIDDVATAGNSLVQSLEILKAIGLKVSKAICLVDREEGAKEALASHQCQLVSIFDRSDFIRLRPRSCLATARREGFGG